MEERKVILMRNDCGNEGSLSFCKRTHFTILIKIRDIETRIHFSFKRRTEEEKCI